MNAFMSFLGPQLPRVSHVYAREHAMRLTVEIYILYIGSYEKTFAVEIGRGPKRQSRTKPAAACLRFEWPDSHP